MSLQLKDSKVKMPKCNFIFCSGVVLKVHEGLQMLVLEISGQGSELLSFNMCSLSTFNKQGTLFVCLFVLCFFFVQWKIIWGEERVDMGIIVRKLYGILVTLKLTSGFV